MMHTNIQDVSQLFSLSLENFKMKLQVLGLFFFGPTLSTIIRHKLALYHWKSQSQVRLRRTRGTLQSWLKHQTSLHSSQIRPEEGRGESMKHPVYDLYKSLKRSRLKLRIDDNKLSLKEIKYMFDNESEVPNGMRQVCDTNLTCPRSFLLRIGQSNQMYDQAASHPPHSNHFISPPI